MKNPSPVLSSPLRQNLRRLNVLRACIAFAVLIAMAIVHWGLSMTLQWVPLAMMMICSILLMVLSGWRLTLRWPVLEWEMVVHLGLDIMIISGLLYFTGGAGNPFVSLYLLPVVVAATTLPTTIALAPVGLAALGYSLLVVYYVPLMPGDHAHHASQFGLHVVGMWLNFLVCTVLVLWVVSRMAGAIRERDRQLARVREKAMRDDKVVSLGLLAAGAAHELATPISTMSVLIKEMSQADASHAAYKNDLAVLGVQVDHCRNIIHGLAASAGQAQSTNIRRVGVHDFVTETIERWQLLRPSVPVTTRFVAQLDDTGMVADDTLATTLSSLMNNAADASPAGIEFQTRCEDDVLTLEILDQGPGISEDVMRDAGRALVTTKPAGKGWGIGLLLANATIERMGGSIVLLNRREGGTCTRIRLPWRVLQRGVT